MKPTNQMAHLLADMICGKEISEQQYDYNRFRGSISDLRLDFNVVVKFRDVDFTNSFGRKSRHRFHFILPADRKHALEVFYKINQEKKAA